MWPRTVEWEVLPSRMCVLTVTDMAFRVRTTFVGSSLGMGRNRATGGVRHAAASKIGGLRTGSWLHKTARTTEKHKSVGRMRHRKARSTT